MAGRLEGSGGLPDVWICVFLYVYEQCIQWGVCVNTYHQNYLSSLF